MRLNSLRARRALVVTAGVVLAVLVVATVHTAKAGKKDRGYIGVYMQNLTKDVRAGLDLDVKEGVLVSGVADDSPAEKAGIEEGDVVVEFNGKKVEDSDDLQDLVGNMKAGDKVDVVVIRDGKKKTISIEIGDRSEDGFFDWSGDDFNFNYNMRGRGPGNVFAEFIYGPKLGVQASELNDDLAAYFDTKADGGVLVLEVMDESVAEKAGVKAGDVITGVGDEAIKKIADIGDALEDMDEGDQFNLTVLRKGKKVKLDATMDEQSRVRAFRGRAPHVQFDKQRLHRQLQRVPRLEMHRHQEMRDNLREEIDELRQEMKELKEELKKKG